MPRKEYYYAAEQQAARAIKTRARIAAALENPNAFVVNGRNVFIRRECTATCEQPGCGKEFSFVMTTRRRQFCPECAVIRDRERRNRTRTPKKLAPANKPRFQFRYAGYDPSETPLDGDFQ